MTVENLTAFLYFCYSVNHCHRCGMCFRCSCRENRYLTHSECLGANKTCRIKIIKNIKTHLTYHATIVVILNYLHLYILKYIHEISGNWLMLHYVSFKSRIMFFFGLWIFCQAQFKNDAHFACMFFVFVEMSFVRRVLKQ